MLGLCSSNAMLTPHHIWYKKTKKEEILVYFISISMIVIRVQRHPTSHFVTSFNLYIYLLLYKSLHSSPVFFNFYWLSIIWLLVFIFRRIKNSIETSILTLFLLIQFFLWFNLWSWYFRISSLQKWFISLLELVSIWPSCQIYVYVFQRGTNYDHHPSFQSTRFERLSKTFYQSNNKVIYWY